MASRSRELQQAMERLERMVAAEAGRSGKTRNEAATRFDLIDDLLLKVLGWPRDQVRPEEHSRAGYADYALGLPRRRLVVEAKKEGLAFKLPPETPLVAPLKTLFKLDPSLEDAIQQARSYAIEFGLPYGAVCNGHQLVAFLAVRTDGVEPLKGRALAFPSLQSMLDNFSELWDGLSRAGVEAQRLSFRLSDESSAPPPSKPSTFIPGYPGLARVDGLVSDLRVLGDLFLLDIVEHPKVSDDFLKYCYLPSGALSQHAAVTRRVLKSRYPQSLGDELEVDIASARTREGVPEALISDVTSASLTTRPIILLGWVGVGKTMFIRHLVRIEARKLLKKAIVLYVDLLSEPTVEMLEQYVTARFIDALQNEFGVHVLSREFASRAYGRELQEFDEGPFGAIRDSHQAEFELKRAEYLAGLMEDREAHLVRALEVLADEGRQIVIILDNVDQRPAEVQDAVFGLAASMAKSWPGTVFVSLRPDTFNRSKRSGSLAAYQPRVFAVAPPRIDRVLDRRIGFAQKQLAGQGEEALKTDLLTNSDALRGVLEIIRLSLRRSMDLAELVDNISGQNARVAIELLTTVVSSPHVRPQHALEQVEKRPFHSIPFHEFLRALMLGAAQRYDPDSSRVPNLLDISTDDGREHFLLPIIISLLERTAEPGVNEGFAQAHRVYSHCQELGFTPDQVTWQLERAVANRVLEASPLDGIPESYRSTPIGGYIVRKLLSRITYVDEVSIDTPIVDETVLAVIDDAEVLSARMQRADRFRRYLDDQWAPLSDRDTGFSWPAHSKLLEEQVENVEGWLEPSGAPSRRPKQPGRSAKQRKTGAAPRRNTKPPARKAASRKPAPKPSASEGRTPRQVGRQRNRKQSKGDAG